jgi:hypothetical protein
MPSCSGSPTCTAPQGAPTVEAQRLLCRRAVYATQRTCGYPSPLWYRYVLESGHRHDGTCTRETEAFAAATRTPAAGESSVDRQAGRAPAAPHAT